MKSELPPTLTPPPPPLSRCGYIAIVGKPNVGKSTLTNALVGQKVSITSHKAQTTRHRIKGILTQNECQYVFVDTPGFQTKHNNALNRALNKTVTASLQTVDVVLLVVEAGRFWDSDKRVLDLLHPQTPTFLIANKLDKIEQRTSLLPWLQAMQQAFPFREFLPMTAHKKRDIQHLLDTLKAYLPEQTWHYEADDLTDRSERFMAQEIIREKLFRLTGDELPHTSTVMIEAFEEEGRLRRIRACIMVERAGHKAICIGHQGERLKRIGTTARIDMEHLWQCKVFLEIWVKVRSGWADDGELIKAYGYE